MIAIEAQNVRKAYRLYQSPAHRLKEIVLRRPFHSEFVALDDINFSVLKGRTFGIIGENGAGKSTLLKILARTLRPTSGHLAINGRVAALLELGAGFNPELSGEENIYLNAYLLGLSKTEINDKKQEIIDFSELGDFISQPVKTYSSGMHMRLAFSIATSVDPDILIIDEALSVGDQHFQKKCINRMMEFMGLGKTILFCSHSSYLVQELCTMAVWLHHGKIAGIGKAVTVINAYSDWVRAKDASMKTAIEDTIKTDDGGGQKPVWIEKLTVTDSENREIEFVRTGQEICLKMRVRTADDASQPMGHLGFGLNRNDEVPVFGITTKIDGYRPLTFYDGQEICLRFPSISLLSGQYYFAAVAIDEHALHPYDQTRSKMFYVENFCGELGMVKLAHSWEIGTPQATDTAK